MEPRTETGNRGQHREPTGNDPATKRARIAVKARSQPKEQFTNLMHHVTPELVQECLNKTPGKSSPGVDGMTVEQARKGISWILPPLMEAIHRGQYEAPPVRRVYIPKANGGQRPLGVPAVVDRAIQAATACVLNEIYEQDFLPSSFGFRPQRGCHHALATVNELVDRARLNYALEVDIRDFFGSINHEWMMKFLRHRVGDPRMLKLIESWLKAGVMEEGKLERLEKGTPQGGSISPLLANIYLHYVLDLWFERMIKKELRGQAQLVRYADDFVLLFANPQDREDVEVLLKVRLSQFGLSVSEEKTHKTDLHPRENRGQDRRHMSFLGFTIYRRKSRSGKGVITVFQTEGKRFSRAKAAMKEKLKRVMHWEVGKQAEVINATLAGHFNYYGMAGNMKLLENFRYLTLKQWRRQLSRRSQKGTVNWKRMNEILEALPLIRPRIRIPYPALATYVRL